MAAKVPDLSLLQGVVAPEILSAMRAASAQLSRTGVRHALIGALAVGAWGYPRASKGADFLVGDEAFERHEGDLVTMAPGVPVGVGGIPVDHLGVLQHESHLGAALSRPVIDGNLPIAPLEALVYLNLKSPAGGTRPTRSNFFASTIRSRCDRTSRRMHPSCWPNSTLSLPKRRTSDSIDKRVRLMAEFCFRP